MAQLVMCPLHKQENLLSDPENSCTMAVYAVTSVVGPMNGDRDSWVPEDHWPANLTEPISCRFSVRPCLNKKGDKGFRKVTSSI